MSKAAAHFAIQCEGRRNPVRASKEELHFRSWDLKRRDPFETRWFDIGIQLDHLECIPTAGVEDHNDPLRSGDGDETTIMREDDVVGFGSNEEVPLIPATNAQLSIYWQWFRLRVLWTKEGACESGVGSVRNRSS